MWREALWLLAALGMFLVVFCLFQVLALYLLPREQRLYKWTLTTLVAFVFANAPASVAFQGFVNVRIATGALGFQATGFVANYGMLIEYCVSVVAVTLFALVGFKWLMNERAEAARSEERERAEAARSEERERTEAARSEERERMINAVVALVRDGKMMLAANVQLGSAATAAELRVLGGAVTAQHSDLLASLMSWVEEPGTERAS